MLGDPDRLDAETLETARICMESVLEAAESYEPKKEKLLRMNPNEVERELKTMATSIRRVVSLVSHLSGESWWHIELAVLPKAQLDIGEWGKVERALLKSWFETPAKKVKRLVHLSAALERLAMHAAKDKQPPSGPRSRGNGMPRSAHILLWTIAENAIAMRRPVKHSKAIGDIVHQWATEDDPDNCISDRVWRTVKRLLK